MKKSMEEKKKMPQIRFNGFNDDWEQLKLGELSSSFEYGLNAAAKEYDGKNKYIRITDIDDDSRKFKQEDITSPDTDLSSAENYRLSEGDILFTRTGASVGKSYIYKASDGLVYYAGFLIRAKIKKDYNPEFVFQNTLTNDYEKFIKITSMRSGQPGVNAQEYSQYQIMMPCKREQDRISGYLRRLDNLITLHQHKCDQLRNLKKAMLKKMFPQDGVSIPELRFIGFTDTWEQRKLGDVTQIIMGQSPDGSTYSETPKDYILVQGNSDIKDGWVEPRLWTTQVTKKADVGDLIMSVRAPAGSMGKTAYNVVIGRGVAAIKGNEFIFQSLIKKDIEGFWKKITTGSTFESLNSNDIKNSNLLVPVNEEQIKIGQYFSQLDNLITLHQRKLEKLKVIKKSLLSKMFVDAD